MTPISMKLIIFLGNPGTSYQYTRHNIGFLIGNEIAKKLGTSDRKLDTKKQSFIVNINYQGQHVILAKPNTFINLSGNAMNTLLQFYKISLDDSIVIHDDLDLPLEHTRYKFGGSAGGHNGIKHIIQVLGTNNFARLKIGIGRPEHPGADIANYVLGKLPTTTLEHIESLSGDVMTKLNQHFFRN